MKSLLIIVAMLAGCLLCTGCEKAQTTIMPTETTALVYAENELSTEMTIEATEVPTVSEPVQADETKPTEIPQEPVAEWIEDGLHILLDGIDYTYILSDENYWTKRKITSSQEVLIQCDTAFSNINFIWDSIPGVYTIEWDNGEIECGTYGFLHEYVCLPEAVNQCKIKLTDAAQPRLCDVEVYTEGTAPEGVQAWLPPCEQADILVFPTHSDDDALFFGPLISYYAIERELEVQTAFMVEHHGYPERGHERLNGLWEMGIRHYPILGTAPDTATHDMFEAMNYYAASNIEQWQVEQIRRFKPLVVVGHDLEGEYGNGGHKVNAYFLVRAIEAAADSEQFTDSAEKYGVWDAPKLYLHLFEENEIILDVNTPMSNDPAGRTPFEVAEDAFKYHRSQHQYGFRVQQNEWRKYDCRPFGLYRTLVGFDSTADIMDNVNAEEWRA